MKIVAITQARCGSSRLPGKVLLKVNGKSLLEIHAERVNKSKLIDKFIIATTVHPGDAEIVSTATKLNISYSRGAVDDVLDRFYQAVKDEAADYVVRLTSDCPLIDPDLIDNVIGFAIEKNVDYVSNTLKPSFPDGQDIEVIKFSAFEKAWKESKLQSEREHVTPYIWKNSTFFNQHLFSSCNFSNEVDYSSIRLTVDEQNDFDTIQLLLEKLGTDKSWIAYAKYYNENITDMLNNNIVRNEGYQKSLSTDNVNNMKERFRNSEKFRKEIHQLIPGGAHTYSKGDDQFPELSPAAIDRGKGAWLWDIDGNKFLDCSMGLSSVTLGHAFEPVLERVREELDKGVNFQRPSVIEREMAQKFLSLVPQHQMIKFAKNGSIVTTAAVKLARAFTGRKLVAFPADHPFYSYDDWFIGKTACDKGVPGEISELSVTFKSYNIQSLTELFEKYPGQIACVITEPEKNFDGDTSVFLKLAIDLAHKHGAMFIIDEMITGFKTALPGSITKFNLDADMATWGKSTANGFSFCALTGKKEVMELGGINQKGKEKVFLISTTHGGETHAIAAGLATIEFYEKNNVIEKNQQTGQAIISKSRKMLTHYGLEDNITVSDTNWAVAFVFKNASGEIDAGYRTLFLQEMIKNNVLFQGVFIPSYSHGSEEVDFFVAAFEKACKVYQQALQKSYEKYLVGEPAKPVFRKFI